MLHTTKDTQTSTRTSDLSLEDKDTLARIVKTNTLIAQALVGAEEVTKEELETILKSNGNTVGDVFFGTEEGVSDDNNDSNAGSLHEAIKTMVSSRKKGVKRFHNTANKYYSVPVINLFDLSLKDGDKGIIEVEKYDDNHVVCVGLKGTYRFKTPKDFLDIPFENTLKVYIEFRRTAKKGFFKVLEIISVDGSL